MASFDWIEWMSVVRNVDLSVCVCVCVHNNMLTVRVVALSQWFMRVCCEGSSEQDIVPWLVTSASLFVCACACVCVCVLEWERLRGRVVQVSPQCNHGQCKIMQDPTNCKQWKQEVCFQCVCWCGKKAVVLWLKDILVSIVTCSLYDVHCGPSVILNKKQINIMFLSLVQEAVPSAALHFQWQAVSLILYTIRAINVDRINTCVLASVPLLEIACHCWQTNISAWPCDGGEIAVLSR